MKDITIRELQEAIRKIDHTDLQKSIYLKEELNAKNITEKVF